MSSKVTTKIPIHTLLKKDFILLFLISFVGSAGMQLFQSIMSKYAISLNCPDALLGSVISAFAVMVFIGSFLSGTVSDRMNKKILLIISIAGQAIAILGYAYISNGMIFLIGLRMLHGFCFGLNMVVSMSMVSFVLPRESLGTGMGVYGLGQTLSMAIGPSIGLALMQKVGYRNMFLVSFFIVLGATAMAFFVKSIPVVKKDHSGFNIREMIETKAIPLSLISLFHATAYAAVTAFLVIHAEAKGVTNIGLFFTVYAATLLAVRPIMGRIADKYPLRYAIYPTSILLIIALVFIAFASNLLMFLFAAVFMGIGFGGAQPVLQAASLRDIAPNRRGSASATYTMGQSSGFAIGPMIAGTLSVLLGYSGMFAAMTGSAICGMIVLFIKERQSRNGNSYVANNE